MAWSRIARRSKPPALLLILKGEGEKRGLRSRLFPQMQPLDMEVKFPGNEQDNQVTVTRLRSNRQSKNIMLSPLSCCSNHVTSSPPQPLD
jgi:hypothetical protein